MTNVIVMVATYALLALISVVAGYAASIWFAIGALFAAVFALWEAGREKHRDHDSTGDKS